MWFSQTKNRIINTSMNSVICRKEDNKTIDQYGE
jgi:hypothetical protein